MPPPVISPVPAPRCLLYGPGNMLRVVRPSRRPALWWGLAAVVAAALALGLVLNAGSVLRRGRVAAGRDVPFGGSRSCQPCHEDAFAHWENSHHALAERPIQTNLDMVAFHPPWTIRHGSQTSVARQAGGRFELVTLGTNNKVQPFPVERVLGVSPLRQFLVRFPGGRYQMTELAFDPQHPDWFDVYGEEDRQPGEWGHWTGRGMTWNAMCAGCHNTGVSKNYDASTDSYRTTLVEHGVGCEACHGPMADHNAWQAAHPRQKGDPTVRKLSGEAMFHTCAGCHARRGDLTGRFAPRESFFDHYWLSMVDETDLFHPDGQIRDEDFEFTAFLGSRMHAGGVRCVNCHEPHALKPRLSGNALCLTCHANTLSNAAPQIDLTTHSHHKADDRGDLCTGCHMPQTVYMQRHARHDHGFTIPDPLLTRQFGIPNACNRCHTERTADWALDYVQQWYGTKMDRPYRQRAQTVARARAGDRAALDGLLRMCGSDTNAYWRAAAANLLRPWIGEARVQTALVAAAADAHPLVRVAAFRALEPLAQHANPAVQSAFHSGLDDPVRGVRVAAAWALRETVATNSVAGRELLAYLDYNCDQPAGELQRGILHLDRGDLPTALACFRRAVQWAAHSAPLRHALAVALSLDGKPTEAVRELEEACRLSPRDPELRYKLGLAYGEANRPRDALAALKQATELDPQYARAWYNLGLAHAAAGNDPAALDCLTRAESLDSRSPEIPYARATVLARLGRTAEARAAAARALELQPGRIEARQLLEALGR